MQVDVYVHRMINILKFKNSIFVMEKNVFQRGLLFIGKDGIISK